MILLKKLTDQYIIIRPDGSYIVILSMVPTLPGFCVASTATMHRSELFFSDYLRTWLNQNIGLTDEISDRWTRHQHFSTVAQLVQAILQVKLHGVDLDDTWLEVVDRARQENAMARLMTNQQLLISQEENIKEQIEVELKWMDGFDVDKEELFGAGIKGQFFAIKASFIERLIWR